MEYVFDVVILLTLIVVTIVPTGGRGTYYVEENSLKYLQMMRTLCDPKSIRTVKLLAVLTRAICCVYRDERRSLWLLRISVSMKQRRCLSGILV